MSVRKRKWTTSKGEPREAWVVDYFDAARARHTEAFSRKKDADAREAEVKVDIKAGVHVAPSKAPTVREAGQDWLKHAEARGLERATT
jgi:integrase